MNCFTRPFSTVITVACRKPASVNRQASLLAEPLQPPARKPQPVTSEQEADQAHPWTLNRCGSALRIPQRDAPQRSRRMLSEHREIVLGEAAEFVEALLHSD